MASLAGVEPAWSELEVPCLIRSATRTVARRVGFEPTRGDLEAPMIPFHQRPVWFSDFGSNEESQFSENCVLPITLSENKNGRGAGN